MGPFMVNGDHYANRPFCGRGRSYYGNNDNPGNNHYIVNDHHEKDHHQKHAKHHGDD